MLMHTLVDALSIIFITISFYVRLVTFKTNAGDTIYVILGLH